MNEIPKEWKRQAHMHTVERVLQITLGFVMVVILFAAAFVVALLLVLAVKSLVHAL